MPNNTDSFGGDGSNYYGMTPEEYAAQRAAYEQGHNAFVQEQQQNADLYGGGEVAQGSYNDSGWHGGSIAENEAGKSPTYEGWQAQRQAEIDSRVASGELQRFKGSGAGIGAGTIPGMSGSSSGHAYGPGKFIGGMAGGFRHGVPSVMGNGAHNKQLMNEATRGVLSGSAGPSPEQIQAQIKARNEAGAKMGPGNAALAGYMMGK